MPVWVNTPLNEELPHDDCPSERYTSGWGGRKGPPLLDPNPPPPPGAVLSAAPRGRAPGWGGTAQRVLCRAAPVYCVKCCTL
eukprot:gene22718-biopygen23764